MGEDSKIEWTDASYTPIRARNLTTGKIGWHCEHATTGCEFCYAEGMNKRLGTGLPFKPGHRKDIEIFLDEKMLLAPLCWKKPRLIFVCSMTDLFADFVKDEWIDRVFAVMALCPQHTFQVLTKRAERMREYCRDQINIGRWRKAIRAIAPDREPSLMSDPLPNVWLGVSAERQQEADERIPLLLQTPAAIRFVSLEPLLGPLSLIYCNAGDRCVDALRGTARYGVRTRPGGPLDSSRLEPSAKLDWVIVGGESGPKARPMHPDWPRDIRDQCEASGVAFFYKQTGEWAPLENHRGLGWNFGDERTGYFSEDAPGLFEWRHKGVSSHGQHMLRVGKKAAGRTLDGRTHDAMPEVRP